MLWSRSPCAKRTSCSNPTRPRPHRRQPGTRRTRGSHARCALAARPNPTGRARRTRASRAARTNRRAAWIQACGRGPDGSTSYECTNNFGGGTREPGTTASRPAAHAGMHERNLPWHQRSNAAADRSTATAAKEHERFPRRHERTRSLPTQGATAATLHGPYSSSSGSPGQSRGLAVPGGPPTVSTWPVTVPRSGSEQVQGSPARTAPRRTPPQGRAG